MYERGHILVANDQIAKATSTAMVVGRPPSDVDPSRLLADRAAQNRLYWG
jgi:hypothetical protein